MSIPLMSLPGYQTGNTLLNFEPIQRALDQKIRMDQVQQEQAFRQQRADKADARDDEMMMRQRGEAFGNKALAFANLPAEQRDPAAWDRILKDHPDYANLPAQYRDPMKSPDLVAAEFGKFRDRLKDDETKANIRVKNAQANAYDASVKGKSEEDRLDLESKRLAVEKARYDKDNAYTSTEYRQKFKSAQALGFNNEAAAQFASGMIKIETDPVSKRRYYKDAFGRDLDEATLMQPTASGIPLPQSMPIADVGPASSPGGAVAQPTATTGPQQQPQIAPQAPTDSLFLRADKITGTLQTLGAAASNVTENVPNAVTLGAAPGFRSVSKETQDAQREFDFFKREVQRVLALNPRIPVYEQQKLDGLIDRGMLTSPDKMRATLVTLHDNLERRIAQEMPLINDRDAPPDQRREAFRFVREARAMLQVMGVPPKLGPEEARKLPPGTYFRSVDGNRILRVPGGR